MPDRKIECPAARRRNRHCFVFRTPLIATQPARYVRHTKFSSCTTTSRQENPQPPDRSPSTNTCCCPTTNQHSPASAPSTQSSGSANCCCPPPEPKKPRCCVPASTLTEPQDVRVTSTTQTAPAAPAPVRLPPRQIAPYVPQLQPYDENIEEPNDPYYNYSRNYPAPAVNPLANFDLSRFDRDQTAGPSGHGRRRNVSIRTCVDYDYEPGNHGTTQPYQPRPHIPPPQRYAVHPPLYPYVPQPQPQPYPAQLYPVQPPTNTEHISLNPFLPPGYTYDPCPYRR